MSDEVTAAARAFLDSFEAVFHEDWAYTNGELGAEDRDKNATFLQPGETVEELDYINWGNYQTLLERYAVLCKALGRPYVSPK